MVPDTAAQPTASAQEMFGDSGVSGGSLPVVYFQAVVTALRAASAAASPATLPKTRQPILAPAPAMNVALPDRFGSIAAEHPQSRR